MPETDRRQWIVEAAAQAFSQFGYKATTMDTVAKIANVGKGTIYTFFSTKEELFEDILRRALQQMKEVLAEGLRPGAPFFDNLVRVLDALLEFRADHELFIKLSQEIRDVGTPQAREGLQRLEAAVLQYLRQEIENAVEKGELRPCNAEIVAFMMLRLYTALTSDWSRSHPPMGKGEIKEHIRLLVAEGLLVK